MYYECQNARNDLENYISNIFGMTKDEFKTNSYRLMKSNLIEKEDEYVLQVELPDVKKEDINIKFDEGYLTVSVKEREVKDEENTKYLLKERYFGKISRSYYFEEQINKEDISAKYENGILNVVLKKPVKIPEESKIIAIE